ncbi:MAG: hypothetical protein JSV61_12550 [Anaerolineales bacterium]|nr:MAG: hypothetical protein JSV61_12550 [Anaerolineales bacterium]
MPFSTGLFIGFGLAIAGIALLALSNKHRRLAILLLVLGALLAAGVLLIVDLALRNM